MITSIGAVQLFDKIEHPFMFEIRKKKVSKLATEEKFFNFIKDNYENLAANTILNDKY